MHWVLNRILILGGYDSIVYQNPYSKTGAERYLDTAISRESVDRATREKVGGRSTIEDLKKDRN